MPEWRRYSMATLDRRGATVSAADPPIGTNPNPDLAIKAPVRVATTGANITLSGIQTIDANNNSQWTTGTQVVVTNGTTNANGAFKLTAVNPIVLGTSALTFALVSQS